jgi:aminopeptidase N
MQEQYIYTQLETDYCHWVFPVFDQPDIKAPWSCTAVIPADWDAVSNEFTEASQERSQADLETVKQVSTLFGQDLASFGELKVIPFKQSYKISPYLYALCAGSYLYQERNTEGLPPMRIYARKSLISELNFDEMFTVTQAGIKFYSVFFGAAYPFNKYD